MSERSHAAVLEAMLDRLYGALMRTPSLNCRPHRSRQRLDLTDLAALRDTPPTEVLERLLSGGDGTVSIDAEVPLPPDVQGQTDDGGTAPADPELRRAAEAYRDQARLVKKFRTLDQDNRLYTQETGVHALQVGYPLLSVPPGGLGATSRVLAPLAFIPVDLAVRGGASPGVDLACQADGVDRVVPNVALFAWIERHTGHRLPEGLADAGGETRPDDDNDGPDGPSLGWPEVEALIAWVVEALSLEDPEAHADTGGDARTSGPPWWTRLLPPAARRPTTAPTPPASAAPDPTSPAGVGIDAPLTPPPPAAVFTLQPCPSTPDLPREPTLLGSAVLGLFPAANEGLIRDTRAMIDAGTLEGPVRAFTTPGVSLDPSSSTPHQATEPQDGPGADPSGDGSIFADDRFVTLADPCQARAARLARSHAGLVLHGPPGTGKSQTITNIIGDHLARGERVLFVSDKRTALDVVANKLAAAGLGGLAAVVHDPKRDQRDLYMSLRAQLDTLPDDTGHPDAADRLARVDQELAEHHRALTRLHRSLMTGPDAEDPLASATSEASFHDLTGRWLGAGGGDAEASKVQGFDPALAAELVLPELDRRRDAVMLTLDRSAAVGYATHPWAAAAGSGLDAFLNDPLDVVRGRVARMVELAEAADATAAPAAPPFHAASDLNSQAGRRSELAGLLNAAALTAAPGREAAAAVAGLPEDRLAPLAAALDESSAERAALQTPLDPALAAVASGLSAREAAEELGVLRHFLDTANRWWGFLALGPKRQAAAVLRGYGLTRSVPAAQQVVATLEGRQARQALDDRLQRLGLPATPAAGSGLDGGDDAVSLERLAGLDAALAVRLAAQGDPVLEPLAAAALTDDAARAALVDGLRRSEPRSSALHELERELRVFGLFNPSWLDAVRAELRAWVPPSGGGRPALPLFQRLHDRFADLEEVLRIHDGLARLPEPLRRPVDAMMRLGADASAGLPALEQATTAAALSRRLAADPTLARLDPVALAQRFTAFHDLEADKRAVVCEAVRHRWLSRQRERLLVGTGSKLNSLGASVRQRLFVRGKRALRLRQAVAVGRRAAAEAGDGGDPIFDLRPVWMASPETVAQVLPREAMFDLVVFDEASQVRLEEALPVLTRARRVVIAGDPKQLPPTRFFEAAFEDDGPEDIEDEDDLFEAQQSGAEDLLSAALNLDVQEGYLDVHYRSQDPDLIGFSNEHFYRGRLQALPGHPDTASASPGVRLQRVDGTYEDRTNPAEAQAVVALVRTLLERDHPPSIGIACFNVAQRDLIDDTLDAAAVADSAFGRLLAAARERVEDGAFQGLFVKNLENVQGDERDHLIVSTTYGPNAQGRFYRRFGPLAVAGGGRRLNVLVTRAREVVHVLTSIPQAAYQSAEAVPEGGTPSGSWLLFAYLRYAEALAADTPAAVGSVAPAFQPTPDPVSAALTRRLPEVGGGWGEAGFRVDAVAGPAGSRRGVLSDFNRYAGTGDPVLWDLYRVGILRWQGWELERVWSPTLYRDPAGVLGRLTP